VDENRKALDDIVQEAVKEHTQKLARTTVGIMVAIITAGAGFLGTGGLEHSARPDPFTGSDGEKLEARISARCREHIMQEFKLHKLEPQHLGTRARLYHLEEWAERQDPTYERPTTDW
jgi:hypothetical protein